MAREQLGHPKDERPQRLGAQVGTQVAIPLEIALQQEEPYVLDYTKIR